jgi:hypothetical protein
MIGCLSRCGVEGSERAAATANTGAQHDTSNSDDNDDNARERYGGAAVDDDNDRASSMCVVVCCVVRVMGLCCWQARASTSIVSGAQHHDPKLALPDVKALEL